MTRRRGSCVIATRRRRGGRDRARAATWSIEIAWNAHKLVAINVHPSLQNELLEADLDRIMPDDERTRVNDDATTYY